MSNHICCSQNGTRDAAYTCPKLPIICTWTTRHIRRLPDRACKACIAVSRPTPRHNQIGIALRNLCLLYIRQLCRAACKPHRCLWTTDETSTMSVFTASQYAESSF